MSRTILFLLAIMIAGCTVNKQQQPVDSKNPRIVVSKDIDLVGTLNTSTIQQMNFPQYWEEFFPILAQTKHKKNNKFYGTMFWDEQPQMTKETPIHYLVGVPSKVIPKIQSPWVKHIIPGGTYAVFIHQGTLDKIMETYSYIYGEWLPNAPYKERHGDQFEYYDERFKDNSPDSIIEIWVPVEKK